MHVSHPMQAVIIIKDCSSTSLDRTFLDLSNIEDPYEEC